MIFEVYVLIFIMVMTILMCYLGTRKPKSKKKISTITGTSISVNGKEYKPGEDDKKIGNIEIHIDVHGNIKSGGIKTVSGCITAKNVSGNVSTLSGKIEIAEGVKGNINSTPGDINIKK